MSTLTLPIAALVRDNTSVLVTFAFSRRAIEALVDQRYIGEWSQLRDTLLQLPQMRAERACLELALLLRYLDDEAALSAFAKEHANFSFGLLHLAEGKEPQPLLLRDVSNKIIHARSLAWSFANPERPAIIAHPRDVEKWQHAEIDVLNLVSVCGNLADRWGAA